MTQVVVDQGEVLALEYLVNKSSPEDLELRLFTNHVIDGLSAAQIEDLDEADFNEATFPGYSGIALTGANWTVTEGDPTEATYSQQEFQASSDVSPAEDVYGYYYVRSTGGELVSFEYFDDVDHDPVTVEFENDVVRVTPRITIRDSQD